MQHTIKASSFILSHTHAKGLAIPRVPVDMAI
ncbi:Putative protein of unknown function [Podospora comata]|uniref:Uncharacterized protein n=1 Tax=Podospora comata TaxID=48703 RepID=A0ABY6S980_PODCO|nr:Putative protein of unknown function [Podospora comata]